MPLYEYQCENCGDRFELIEKFSAEPLTIHEKCGGKVHRLLSAPALQFKGSGWYVTDYAKSGSLPPGNGGKKDGEGSSEKGSSEKGSSDKGSSEKGGSSEKKDAAKSSSDSNSGSSNADSSSSSSSNSTPTTTAPASSSDKK
jgi:putative FmdB family regulatory protein